MLKLQTCYSNSKARRMKENKEAVKKLKASIKDYIYLAISLFILFSVISNFDIRITPKSSVIVKAQEPEVTEIVRERFVAEPDTRVLKLRTYLEERKSPLAPHSELIISEADKYGLDWTKTVAIACLESACGHKLPNGSHNAWGLGGSKFMRFGNWEESIKYVSNLLGTKYKQAENQGVKYSYCPESDGCNPSWAYIVTQTSHEILSLEGER